MSNDDFILTPTEELKGLLAMMSAKQNIHKPRQVILNNDAESYIRLSNFLDIMDVNNDIKNLILSSNADIGLSRSVKKEDILIRLNMIDHGEQGRPKYVKMDTGEEDETQA